MDKNRQTSLKSVIQGLQASPPGLRIGTVVSLSPLSISLAGDDKIKLKDSNCVILDYLRDQTVEVSFSGTASGDVTTSEGSGALKNITYSGTMTIKQGLKVGDQVHILSLNEGKQYIVLGRT